MKKIIYWVINDEQFGIKVKDDMKINVLTILDRIKNVICKLDNQIEIKNNRVVKACFDFYCPEDESFIGRFRIEENMKFFRLAIAPQLGNKNMVEDYIVIEHENGLTEYKTRYVYQNNSNHSKNEYYYNGEEITEEEANNLFNPKTK